MILSVIAPIFQQNCSDGRRDVVEQGGCLGTTHTVQPHEHFPAQTFAKLDLYPGLIFPMIANIAGALTGNLKCPLFGVDSNPLKCANELGDQTGFQTTHKDYFAFTSTPMDL